MSNSDPSSAEAGEPGQAHGRADRLANDLERSEDRGARLVSQLADQRVKTSQSEALFSLLVDSVMDYAMFMLDTTGRVATWNTGARRIKGYTADEIIGQHFSRFYPAEVAATGLCDRELLEAEREGRFEAEGWRIRKDGSRFWANVIITAVRDHGTLVGFAKVTRDLTERKRSEEQQSVFRLLVAAVEDYAIFMLDPNGVVATWNAGAERIKGYVGPEIIGRHFSAFYPQEDVRAGKCEHELDVATREGRFEEEGWRIRKDGTRFWANVLITRVLDSDRKLIGFAKVTRDLTERRSRERLEQEIADQKRTEELREQLIGIVGHDLRAPISAITMAAQLMMKRGELPLKDGKSAALIARNADRMEKMISQLLDFTRTRLGGGMPVARQPMQLSAACSEILAAYEVSHPDHTVTFECDPNTQGEWDPERIAQVLANLIGNAVQHGGPDAAIWVRARDEGSVVSVAVHNSGTSIPPEFLPILFEPFRRAAGPHARPVGAESLGLGLFIVREIVQAHGGSVAVESSDADGTTFTVRLPRAPPGQLPTPAE